MATSVEGLDQIVARLTGMPEPALAKLADELARTTADTPWIPNVGPQTAAFFCKADLLLYGGQGGGGKSDLILGIGFSLMSSSLIMRRHYTDLSAMIKRAIAINGGRQGFNGSAPPKLITKLGRTIDFGAAANFGDEQQWQGQPHAFLGIDEAVQFLEAQIRFLMGWVREAGLDKAWTRTVLASNPPVTVEGQWIIGMFRPWLDLTYGGKKAADGELRWYVRAPDDTDIEVDGSRPVQLPGMAQPLIPKSRTFIHAELKDNPYLINTGYQKELDNLPEPYRSAIRDGNFMAARKDAANQVIPTAWIREAIRRWKEIGPKPPDGVPMTAMGVDVAQGGEDQFVIAPLYDFWFAPMIVEPGRNINQTRAGSQGAGLIVSHRRDEATVVIDLGGGWGGSVLEHLLSNDPSFPIVGHKGAAASMARTRDNKLKFHNKRSQVYWQFREALDPDQRGGSPVALPDDPELTADLTAPTFEIDARGIAVEPKEDVVKKLGRSPDKGDAVVQAWSTRTKEVMDRVGAIRVSGEMGGQRDFRRNQLPKVIMGHQNMRGRR